MSKMLESYFCHVLNRLERVASNKEFYNHNLTLMHFSYLENRRKKPDWSLTRQLMSVHQTKLHWTNLSK